MRSTMTLLACLLLVAGCGGGGPGDTPEATFESFQSAVRAEDWDGVVDLMSPAALKQAGEQLEEMKKNLETPGADMMLKMMGLTKEELEDIDSAREFAALSFEKMAAKDADDVEKMKRAEVVETKIDGDKAKLTVKDGDWDDQVPFVRIDGKWYLGDM